MESLQISTVGTPFAGRFSGRIAAIRLCSGPGGIRDTGGKSLQSSHHTKKLVVPGRLDRCVPSVPSRPALTGGHFPLFTGELNSSCRSTRGIAKKSTNPP